MCSDLDAPFEAGWYTSSGHLPRFQDRSRTDSQETTDGANLAWTDLLPLRIGHGGLLSNAGTAAWRGRTGMIRKLKSGQYRLYSRKVEPRTGRRRDLGTVRPPGTAGEN